jgi:hypothetical protein
MSKEEPAANIGRSIGGIRQAGGMAEWTEWAGPDSQSNVRATSRRIGERPGEAVEGILDGPQNRAEFEGIRIDRVDFSEGKTLIQS